MTANLARLIDEQRFVITTELVPPRGADPHACRAHADRLASFADAINVTDGAGAAIRMSALAAAAIVAKTGIAPIVQMTCRDRNRIALAADVIGAASVGAVGVLALFGDPVKTGPTPDALEIRDLDPLGLIGLVAGLNAGVLPSGATIEPATRLLIGAAATPGPAPVDSLAAKIRAGATFVQTQIVLDCAHFAAWLGRVRADADCAGAAVLPSVCVPASGQAAIRLRGLGAHVPDAVVERAERGDGEAIAAEVARDLVRMDGVTGLHLIALGADPAVLARLAATARAEAGARARAATGR